MVLKTPVISNYFIYLIYSLFNQFTVLGCQVVLKYNSEQGRENKFSHYNFHVRFPKFPTNICGSGIEDRCHTKYLYLNDYVFAQFAVLEC